MKDAPDGFIVYLNQVIKPRSILNDTTGILPDETNDPGCRIVLADTLKGWRRHNDIANPIGTRDQDGLRRYLINIGCHLNTLTWK
jgi:hypothetical protein